MHDNTNKVLFDWVSISTKELSPKELIDFIGMTDCNWIQGKGFHGYQTRLYCESISVHSDGAENMGTWLEMSGQGCRAFETYGTGDYEALFRLCLDNPKLYNLTRLDVAFDDFTGILNPERIFEDTFHKKFKAKAEKWSAIQSSDGISVVHGSPKSKVLIRIYDKLAERIAKVADKEQIDIIKAEIPHWVRVEIQLRDERALEFVRYLDTLSLGDAFSGVLLNYLSYGYPVPARDNPDKIIWHPFPYWQSLLGNASALSIYVKPGVDYNLTRCKNYVYNMAGNAVDALIKIQGIDGFLADLRARYIKMNPKYIHLVEMNKAKNKNKTKE